MPITRTTQVHRALLNVFMSQKTMSDEQARESLQKIGGEGEEGDSPPTPPPTHPPAPSPLWQETERRGVGGDGRD